MKKRIATITAGILAIPTLALAVPAPKVFVCKYVGTPNVDERLQTGQNPISVSSNAIKDYAGVGSYFNDAQGRSLVIAEDTGQDEPECPTPQNENPPKETPTNPETPKTEKVTPTIVDDYSNVRGK